MKPAALLAPLALAACAAEARRDTISGVTPERVLEAARAVAVEEGFTVEPASAARVVTTQWQAAMAPLPREGMRRRVRVEARPAENGTDVAVFCEREVNRTMSLKPELATWENAGRDDAFEDLVATRIKMKLERLAVEWHD